MIVMIKTMNRPFLPGIWNLANPKATMIADVTAPIVPITETNRVFLNSNGKLRTPRTLLKLSHLMLSNHTGLRLRQLPAHSIV